jgi:carbon monoxide dehydrogenase subunit G
MQLENQFVVDAPLERTWSTLLDIQRVAQCLPGAELESDASDGLYRGSMQVKLGPMSLRYKGSARLAEVDEDGHVATIEVQAKEQKGQGTASARIRNQLRPLDAATTEVTVQTDLSITGRPAQFGRGIMEDVAGKMLEDFAKRLEAEVVSGSGGAPEPAAEDTSASRPAAAPRTAGLGATQVPTDTREGGPEADQARSGSEPVDSALDLGSILIGPLGKRVVVAGGILLLVLLLMRALTAGRRSGLTVTVNWR